MKTEDIVFVIVMFATVVMVFRQVALFIFAYVALRKADTVTVKLSWWLHLVATAALVTATISMVIL